MKKDTFKNWLILFLLLIIIGGGWLLFNHKEQPAPPSSKAKEIVVRAKPLAAENITVAQSFIGNVVAVNSVYLVPYLSGYIAEIPVDSGQQVKKGDIIITLRPEEYKAAMDSAYAAVLSGAADLNNAESQYQRLLKAGAKAVSQTELDSAKTAYLTAKANLKQAEANLETAGINLGYTKITAPFDGVLGNINASVGNFISPSTSNLVRIVQYNPARVIFSVTDKEFLQYNNLFADAVRLQLSNGQDYPYTGKIIYTENVLDKASNSLAVYAEFENPQRVLIPNAYVKVLLEHTYKNAVLISKDLVQLQDNGYFVYAVQDNAVAQLPVQIEAEKGNDFVAKNTFKTNTWLITQETEPSLIGQKVQVQNVQEEEK